MFSFVFFWIVCVLLIIGAFAIAFKMHLSKGKAKRIFSTLQWFTICIFAALFAIFFPYNWLLSAGGGANIFVRFAKVCGVSVQDAFRVFILDGGFKDVFKELLKIFEKNHPLYTLYSSALIFLYVLAPVLTFSNALSLFKLFSGTLRLSWHRKRPMYIFSELNARSIAAAQSIIERYEADKTAFKIAKKAGIVHSRNDYLQQHPYAILHKPVIVFTDVFEKDDEKNFEIHYKARDLNAICLKKDITVLDLKHKTNQIEFFIIGEDESENMSQLIKLTERHKSVSSRSIFLYSNNQNSAIILDSIDKGSKTLGRELESRIESKEQVLRFLFEELKGESDCRIDDGFYLRRIDPFEELAIQTLSDAALVKDCFDFSEGAKLRVLLLGLGDHGMVFLKTLLWMYQVYGAQLEINIVDIQKEEDILKRIHYEMPDLQVQTPKEPSEIEAFAADACAYSVNLYGGVDFFSSDLPALLGLQSTKDERESQQNEAARKYFAQTSLAIICLGADEKNIECATHLRAYFDRLHAYTKSDIKQKVFCPAQGNNPEINNESELPVILSVVYDDQKTKNLVCANQGLGIADRNATPYHIRFIGNLSTLYSYERVVQMKQSETAAIAYHVEWVKNERILREAYFDESEENKQKLRFFKQAMEQERRREGESALSWYDADFYCKVNGKTDFRAPNVSAYMKEIEKYCSNEYYRRSSVAKAIHKRMLESCFEDYFAQVAQKEGVLTDERFRHPCYKSEQFKVCDCKQCTVKRISEHMRWDMYMVANGHHSESYRNDRAKVHNDIRPWSELPLSEQFKD